MKKIIQSSYIKYSTDISFDEAEQLISISKPDENTVMIFATFTESWRLFILSPGVLVKAK